ncbi:MAG: tail fiber domain-containing protein [Candidatus Thorarchaeota archaeon]
MKKIVLLGAIVFLLLECTAYIALADFPRYISVQGRLLDPITDEPLSGSYTLLFKIYDTTPTEIWSKQYDNVDVTNTRGIFNIELGPLNLPFDEEYTLETLVNDVPLFPKINITSSAFTFSAGRLLPTTYPVDVSNDVNASRFCLPGDCVTSWPSGGGGGNGWTVSGSYVYNDTAGVRVGIGTTSPSYKLDVSGNGRFTSTLYADNNIRIDNGNTPTIYFDSASSGDVAIRANGEDLEIYEPEEGGKVWAKFYDDNSLRLSGTPNLIVDGVVGVGTTNPEEKLHIENNSDTYLKIHSTTGSGQTSGIKLQRGTSTDGFTDYYIYDSGGDLSIDSSIGGTDTNRLFIEDNSGEVGIGTTHPGRKLEVQDNSINGFLLRLDDSDARCDIGPNISSVWISCSSDIRLKTNIKDAKPVINDLMKLRIRDFTVKSSGEEGTGIIAQEVQEIMPELVSEGDDGYLMVQQINHWKLVKAIQELQNQIEQLKAENNALDQRIESLELAINAL